MSGATREAVMVEYSAARLWLVLMKAHRAMGRHAQRSLAGQEIGFSDFVILEALLHKGPLAVNEIGRRIHLTSGSMTTAIDRLQQRGLVERTAHAHDRRAKNVSLTRAGRALITKLFRHHEANLEAAAEALTANERATLIDLLKKLGKAADAKANTSEE